MSTVDARPLTRRQAAVLAVLEAGGRIEADQFGGFDVGPPFLFTPGASGWPKQITRATLDALKATGRLTRSTGNNGCLNVYRLATP